MPPDAATEGVHDEWWSGTLTDRVVPKLAPAFVELRA
jgi:hypothetical protein